MVDEEKSSLQPEVGHSWIYRNSGNSGLIAANPHDGTFIGTQINQSQTYQIEYAEGRATTELERLCERVSTLDFSETHEALYDQVTPGTGQWFLDSEKFTLWRREGLQNLWCFGKPGAGKSSLASIVIEELKKQEDCQVAFLYLSYKGTQAEEPSVRDLLGCLASQLLTQWDSPWPSSVKKHLKNSKMTAPLGVKQLGEMLSELASPRTYFIVDALDEFDADKGQDFLHQLCDIKSKILVTSRNKTSAAFEIVDIKAQKEDIHRYIEQKIATNSRLVSFTANERNLEAQIKREVTTSADGIFLLARFHVEFLREKCLNPFEVRAKLQNLPQNRDSMYQQTLSRIKAQEPRHRDYAMSTIGWIMHAYRPLGIQELRHALLAQELKESGRYKFFEHGMLLLEEDILAFCCGLVQVNKSSDTVSLIHYTTHEFFERTRGTHFPAFFSEASLACAAYLCIPALKLDHGESRTMLKQMLENFAFAQYAGLYLAEYFKNISSDELRSQMEAYIRKLLSQVPKVEFFFRLQAYMRSYRTILKLDRSKAPSVGQIREERLSYPKKIKSEYTSRTSAKQLRLHLATFIGSTSLVQELIHEGCCVNGTDNYDQTVLEIAVLRGSAEVMKLLLKMGANIDLLQTAGLETIVLLVQEGLGDTLHEVWHRILEAVGSSLEDGDGKTNFFPHEVRDMPKRVSENTRLEVFNLRGLDAYLQLLSASVRRDADKIVRLAQTDMTFIETQFFGGSLNFKYALVKTSFFVCVENCDSKSARAFLKSGFNANSRNLRLQTALHRAVSRNSEDMVGLLLEFGAGIEARDVDGNTAWTANACPNRATVLRLLKNSGANINSRNLNGLHPIHNAAAGGQVVDLEFLLELGVDPSIRSKSSWTPLHFAAQNGHVECVTLLVKSGADLTIVAGHTASVLDIAKENNKEAVATILVNAGAKTMVELDPIPNQKSTQSIQKRRILGERLPAGWSRYYSDEDEYEDEDGDGDKYQDEYQDSEEEEAGELLQFPRFLSGVNGRK
ncbi:hypothetical protein HDK90DRAFT_467677 [Phyllosticta capitalensis]|uniref:NACHT domain-containing protein n=1 Tax=Phyllosticta capitalensis TaxID=121624 RepID=A0ABR1YL52_9PEZI